MKYNFELRKRVDYDPATKVTRFMVKAKTPGTDEWIIIGSFASEWWMEVFLGAVNTRLSGSDLEGLAELLNRRL